MLAITLPPGLVHTTAADTAVSTTLGTVAVHVRLRTVLSYIGPLDGLRDIDTSGDGTINIII